MKKIYLLLSLLILIQPLFAQSYTSIDQLLTEPILEKYYNNKSHKYSNLEKKYGSRIKSAKVTGVTAKMIEDLFNEESDIEKGDVNFTYSVDVSGLDPKEVCEVVALIRTYPMIFVLFASTETMLEKAKKKDKYDYKLNISAYESIMKQGQAYNYDLYVDRIFGGKKPKGYSIMKMVANRSINSIKSEFSKYQLYEENGVKKVKINGEDKMNLVCWIDQPNTMVIYID